MTALPSPIIISHPTNFAPDVVQISGTRIARLRQVENGHIRM
jgi:hypothetical protein